MKLTKKQIRGLQRIRSLSVVESEAGDCSSFVQDVAGNERSQERAHDEVRAAIAVIDALLRDYL
jgi:hypothetical protein